MNRRRFFKILAGAVIAPFVFPKIKPKSKIKRNLVLKMPWKKYHTTYHFNTTEKQKLTKDLEKAMFGSGKYFTKPL